MNDDNQLPANISKTLQGVKAASQRMQAASGDVKYLKFAKGIYAYGTDALEVEEGSTWAINLDTVALGFICWAADGSLGKPLGEEMCFLHQEPVFQANLPDVPNGKWQEQCALQLKCMTGEDEGEQVLFKTSTMGGLNAFRELLADIEKHVNAEPGTTALTPVVEMGKSSFNSPKYGKIHRPLFIVRSWLDANAPEAEEPENEKPEVAEEAPRRRKRSA